MSHTSSVPLDIPIKIWICMSVYCLLINSLKHIGHERAFSTNNSWTRDRNSRSTDIANGVVHFKALKFQENRAYGLLFIFGRIARRRTEPEIDSVARLCPRASSERRFKRSFRAVDPKDGRIREKGHGVWHVVNDRTRERADSLCREKRINFAQSSSIVVAPVFPPSLSKETVDQQSETRGSWETENISVHLWTINRSTRCDHEQSERDESSRISKLLVKIFEFLWTRYA